MQEDQEIVQEFLVESHENLSRLDQDMVELEARPGDAALLASVFRTMHTIKGTCGFLGFSILEKIAHRAEGLLSLLRDGRMHLTPPLVSLILEAVDATRRVLARIEASGQEGEEQFGNLTSRLEAAAREDSAAPAAQEQSSSAEGDGSPQAEAAPREEEAAKTSAAAEANIRVGVGLLDKLMDLVGELVLARNQILQFTSGRANAALCATSQRLNLITTELQESVMKTRMQPIGVVWNKLPRVVRDLALSLGKQIRLELDGAETELDRTIIEAIKDPLVHLVRNACDHGIETAEARQRAGKAAQGRLCLRAYHEGGQVNIEIADDGAGIDVARVKQKAIEKGLLAAEQAQKICDREAFNLIFSPGFSTAAKVTNLSGRGVGMDVVRTHIERIGGTVDLSSRTGEGTTVKIKIPLTLAIIPGLVIGSGDDRFVIPQVSLLELIRLEGGSVEKRIEHVNGTPVYRRRGRLLPIAYLSKVLGLAEARRGDAVNIVVLQAEDRQFGLVVDGICDTQEIVVKPLGKQLKGLTVYAGATIMGDGRVALILDVLGIGQSSGVLGESLEAARGAGEHREQAKIEPQRLLLFRAGSFERIAVPLSLVARLEELPASSIERAGGALVVQYRGRILPLAPLAGLLEEGAAAEASMQADPAQVIVFSDGERSLGVLVDQILDISEEAVNVRQRNARKGFLGSGVVGRRVADFLDLESVLANAGTQWWQPAAGGERAATVLVAEASGFLRSLIRNKLEMAGYAVLEAADLEEAVRSLEANAIDVVIGAEHLPPGGCSGLRALMRERAEWKQIPVAAIDGPAEGIEELAAEALRTARAGCAGSSAPEAAMPAAIA